MLLHKQIYPNWENVASCHKFCSYAMHIECEQSHLELPSKSKRAYLNILL